MDQSTSDVSPPGLVLEASVPPTATYAAVSHDTETNKLPPPSSSNESAGGDADRAATSIGAVQSRSSPTPNCAICLSTCKDKCYTESCMHEFCFTCLCEWSKTKPECPLCKKPFRYIKHNVRSADQYDTYRVEINQHLSERSNNARFLTANYLRPNIVAQYRQPIVVDGNGHVTEALGESHRALSHYGPYRSMLLSIYRQEQQAASVSVSPSPLCRCHVYDRLLYASPVADTVTGRFREWSARFYRDNPAQIHRLMPWISRDVSYLLRNTQHRVCDVMQIIRDLLPISNMLDPTFRRRLTPFLGVRTAHFIHELFNFARSPYDIVGYDRIVHYSARRATQFALDYMSTEEDPWEYDLERHAEDLRSGGRSRQEESSSSIAIASNPSAGTTHSLNVSVPSDDIMLPSMAVRSASNSMESAAINLSIHRGSSDVIEIDDEELDGTEEAGANAEVAANNNNNNQNISNQNRRRVSDVLPVTDYIDLSDSSSSSDDCEFVLERKAPHLRTPEFVSLNSDSDSDVVFIGEIKPWPQPVQSVAPAIIKTDQTQEDANHNEMFIGASTSRGVISNAGNSRRKIIANAQRRHRHGQRRLRSGPRSTRARHEQQRVRSSSPSSDSTCE